jgi:hypothetical protein
MRLRGGKKRLTCAQHFARAARSHSRGRFACGVRGFVESYRPRGRVNRKTDTIGADIRLPSVGQRVKMHGCGSVLIQAIPKRP